MAKNRIIGPFRISAEEYEAIKTATEAHQEKTADFIRAAATFLTDLSAETRGRLTDFSEHVHRPPGMIAEALIVRYFAEREARDMIWGRSELTPDVEFTVMNGTLLSGEALYSFLLRYYTQRYASEALLPAPMQALAKTH